MIGIHQLSIIIFIITTNYKADTDVTETLDLILVQRFNDFQIIKNFIYYFSISKHLCKDKIAYIDIDKLLNQSIAGKINTKK